MSKLLSSLPVGALVKDPNFTYLGSPVILRVLEHGHTGDPAGSTTLECSKIICCKAWDARESDNENMCDFARSNIFRWLNSDSSAGQWFSKDHTEDNPPDSLYVRNPVNANVLNPYTSEAGFLTFIPSKLRSSILTRTTAYSDSYKSSKKSKTTNSQIFLLSSTELGISKFGRREGSKYSYYSGGNLKHKQFINDTAAQQTGNTNWTASYYGECWTTYCSKYEDYDREVELITSESTSSTTQTTYPDNAGKGIAPAFCVPSNLKVSDTASGGVYSFVWNATPTISPASTNYGNVATPPAITCTIADADGDSFTYTVKLNGVTMTSGSATASKTFALDMTSYWSQMALGTNTIVVQATDSQGATASATYTMNKTNSAAPVPTTDLVNNSRKDTSFYIGFQIGQDADGDSQTVVAQVSDSSDMSDPTEFTSVEKLVAGAWIPVQTLTNADAGASLRIQVTGQTVGDTIYVRLKDTDSGSGSPVYTSIYAVSIGSTLEFDTLPISRTTKPSIVVAYLDKTITNDATVQMYACNNANDATPTWEPITEGESHQFTNKTKTATNWGVSVKTNIAAGATAGEISVSAVGLGVL